MDASLTAVVALASRWLHIMSVIVLIGSGYYAMRIKSPFTAQYRSTVLLAILFILGSGLYNLLTKEVPRGYHMWFGIKMLLVLHIFAVLFLATTPGSDTAKNQRWIRSAVYSAALVVALSAYLRFLGAAA